MSDVKISKGEKTRFSVIKAAQKLFAINGYAATGVDSIVAEVGVTTGVFYANFKSKEDVLKASLKQQIDFSRAHLLMLKPDESHDQWVERILSSYLSEAHRDHPERSCPMTTMSQELQKLKLSKKTGLSDYINEFEETLADRLNDIRPGLGKMASSVISMCVGTLITSRTLAKADSDRYLMASRKTIKEFILATR